MAEEPQGPDEVTFREDLAHGSFLVGTMSGQWDVVNFTWPFVLAWISAAERKGRRPDSTCVSTARDTPRKDRPGPSGTTRRTPPWTMASGRRGELA